MSNLLQYQMKQLLLIFLLSLSATSFSNTIEKDANDGSPQAQFLFAQSLLNEDALIRTRTINNFFIKFIVISLIY